MPVLEYTPKASVHRRKRKKRTAAVTSVLFAFLLVGGLFVFWDKLFPAVAQQPEQIPVPPPTQQLPTEPTGSVSETPDEPSDGLPAVPAEEQKYLLLASKENPLPDGYTPTELAPVPGSIYKMDKAAGEALASLLSDMKAAGIRGMEVKSAYRTYEKQKQLYENKVAKLSPDYTTLEEAQAAAATIVAIPGTSEHQTGYSADIANTPSLEESFGDTDAGKWLAAHSYEYGFIIRYPKGKSDYTGIIYEPWHVRYVGKAAAEYITRNGLCLEEFLKAYQPSVD